MAKFLAMISQGYSVSKGVTEAGVNRKTIYDWRNKDEDFADAWDEAIKSGNERLEDEAVRRAVEGVQRPVFGKLGKIGDITEYSDTLLKFMLVGRNRKKYGSKTTVELTGANGGPVRAAQAVAEAASATDAAALYKEIMGAALEDDD
jgi:hypothetical protein